MAMSNLQKQHDTEVVVACDELAKHIQSADVDAFSENTKLLLRRGANGLNMKFAFTCDSAAKHFLAHLQNRGFKKITYYGNEEMNPMDDVGQFNIQGQYRYIVRLKIQDALKYIYLINATDGSEPPIF